MPHAPSWYAASSMAVPDRAVLHGATRCDVCVIGAGITGCSAALHLAERGYRVIVLEAARVGFGGSGRSGGQLLNGFSVDQSRLRQLVGDADAERLWKMSLEAVELCHTQIDRFAIPADLRFGYLHAALKPRQVEELRLWQADLQDNYGYDRMRLLTGDDLREEIDSPRYLAALHDAGSGHLHPLIYTQGLAAAAEAAGAVIHEASGATSIDPQDSVRSGKKWSIKTAGGSVETDHVALCGNAYLGELEPRIASRIMPVGTYIVATESLGKERAAQLLPRRAAVADVNNILDYFRLAGDDRMLFGGRVSYSNLNPPSVAQSIRKRMTRVFPQLADSEVEYAWGGHVAITMNRTPHFGALAPGLYFAHGFSGHGIALTGLAGKLMAEAIAGTAERFDVFARIPHAPFPGGRLLRRPALVLAMLYYRLRDLL